MISISLDNIEHKLPHTEDVEKKYEIRNHAAHESILPGCFVKWRRHEKSGFISPSSLVSLHSSLHFSLASAFLLANISKNKLQELRINSMTPFLLCKMLLMSHFHLKTLLNLSYLLIFTDFPFLNIRPHSSKHWRRCIILIKQWNSNPKQTVKCQRHLFNLCSPVHCTKCAER